MPAGGPRLNAWLDWERPFCAWGPRDLAEVAVPQVGGRPDFQCRPPVQVNTQLYSQKEKQQLAELIGTMLAFNLTYRQERTPDGQYVYKLDP